MDKRHLSWIEIDRKAILGNIANLARLAGPKVHIAAAVKSNGYGHGLPEMVSILGLTKTDYISLHSTAEAEIARQSGWDRKILLVGPVTPVPQLS